MSKRIVVLSGSFNPVSKAHFAILSSAVSELNADKGLFVATNDEYLLSKTRVKAKSRTSFLLNEATRREMISSLSKEDPHLSFWGFELGGAYPSTEKTLRRIGKENPGDVIYYLCGADKLRSIPHWTNADSLLEFVHLAVYGRADFDVDALLKNDPFYQAHRNHVIILPAQDDLLDVSSTKIREKFFAGEDYSDLMNESAYAIMKEFKPSDFPPLTAERIIEATIKYGGHFGKNTARKLVFKENMRLFHEFEGNGFGHKESFIKDTEVYAEEFLVAQLPTNKTAFDCQNINYTDAAFNLINEGHA
ncbi:MAG: nicotinate-nicotinamide nucleotide adenylyltransferase, partial [Bacilli bacterium]|nr:nicotinate-nicotinamide nucleotide adenylyltransferase [Bacilli bacterium]